MIISYYHTQNYIIFLYHPYLRIKKSAPVSECGLFECLFYTLSGGLFVVLLDTVLLDLDLDGVVADNCHKTDGQQNGRYHHYRLHRNL